MAIEARPVPRRGKRAGRLLDRLVRGRGEARSDGVSVDRTFLLQAGEAEQSSVAVAPRDYIQPMA